MDMEECNWKEVHGHEGDSTWKYPRLVVRCDVEARPGYNTKLANEYKDDEEVLQQKIKVLANMLRASTCTLLYTGAGISTAAGIGDYATHASNSTINTPKLRSPIDAQPTLSHKAMTLLYLHNLVHYWIQQNHDGLPQKAGFPQHALNEIHGAWYDPSNPVVPMAGSLRSDLFASMLEWEQRADLTLSLGTSMCGMNADRVFTTVSKKYQHAAALGGVIVGLQQTQYDSISSLRLFCTIDEMSTLLLQELQLDVTSLPALPALNSQVFSVPYDNSGKRSSSHSELDLREGAQVALVSGPFSGDKGEVVSMTREGHFRIRFHHNLTATPSATATMKRPMERLLGKWWILAALEGSIEELPVVNYREK